MSTHITIIGLDRIGLSLGLALKKSTSPVDCTGFDLSASLMKTAMEIKAVDRTFGNLHSAVENADMVFLNSLPLDVTDWMKDVCRSLKPEAVLVNLAPVHRQAGEWAAANLPANRSFLNASPSINGICLDHEENTADLFRNGVMIISTIPDTNADAVQQVLDLAALIGALPIFAEPLEADGLISQTHLFPRLLALLYLRGISEGSGWADAQKVTGPQFWQLSKMLNEFTSGKSAAYEIMAHKDTAIHLLEMMREQIDSLQDSIQKEDTNGLDQSIQQSLDRHNQWMSRRVSGDWDTRDSQTEIKSEGLWKKLFGMGTSKKKS
jgi:prephenate dehydrogenase